MHFTTLLRSSALLAGLAAPWLAAASEESSAPHFVTELNSETFDNFVNEDGLKLVKFYAPWCGHCKALAPEFEAASVGLNEKDIKLAKINCDDNSEVCQAHGVQAYPTLKVYKNGSETPYGGNRKAEGIVSYMVKQSLPAVTPVTAENHEEFQTADKIVILAYLNTPEDALAKPFTAAADTHRDDYLFGLTTDEAAIKAAGVTPPALVVYKKFDEGKNVMTAEEVEAATAGSITAFIKHHSLPLFDEVSGENYQIYSATGLPLAYLFIDPTDQEALTKTVDSLKPVAQKHKGKLNFVWIDAVKFVEHGKNLGLTEGQWPALIIQDGQTHLKYPVSQSIELTPAVVEAHADSFVAGELAPTLKSEAKVEEQTDSYYRMVGSEFEDKVYDDEKDVFVQFFATWCGHCKRLAPTWETLAEKFAGDDSLLIAKMDGEKNDLPAGTPFSIEGFPTLKFKPAGSRQFINYEGDRSLEDLLSFVQKWSKKTHTPKADAPVEEAPAAETGSAARPAATEEAVHSEHDELMDCLESSVRLGIVETRAKQLHTSNQLPTPPLIMPAYHSAFNEDPNAQVVGNMSVLPIKTRIRGPSAPADPNTADIIDETLDLFRANSLFRNFEIKGGADRLLIVLILFVSDCLAKIQDAKTVPAKIEAGKLLSTLAVGNFPLPGDVGFVLNSHYAAPASRVDADFLRSYLVQVRQELAARLIERLYADGTNIPSKWWMCFTKRRFMSRN
ncbi:protein disulfide isomerase [Clavulina sp. PMI_390]|nr:protein disulfide isomerase [Clavulina sp. PMI_390]